MVYQIQLQHADAVQSSFCTISFALHPICSRVPYSALAAYWPYTTSAGPTPPLLPTGPTSFLPAPHHICCLLAVHHFCWPYTTFAAY